MTLSSRSRWLFYLMLISWLGWGISAEATDQPPYHALSQQQAYPVPTATPPAAPPTATSDPFFSTPTPRADGKIIYIVQAGDTLVGIATRFGYSVEQLNNLYELNGLTRDDFLLVGQELLLGRDQGAVVPLAGNVPPRYAGATYREADNAFVHEVQAGDTLISIALKYGYRTMDAFYAISGLQVNSLIGVGQAVIVGYKPIPAVTGGSSELPLTIPPPPPTTAPPTPRPTATHLPTATPLAFPTIAPTVTERVATLDVTSNLQATPVATFVLADAPQGDEQIDAGKLNKIVLGLATGMGLVLIGGAVGWFVWFGRKN